MKRLITLALTVLVVAAACGDSTTSAPTSATTDVTAGGLSYPIVETNQTAFYDNLDESGEPVEGEAFYGQDAGYEGYLPSYTDNGDGTVTDEVTGLMWQQDPGEKMTFAEAVAGADSFDLAGYDDWRLPTIKELYSLILFSGTDPSGCEDAGSCEATPFIDTGYFGFEYGDESAGERIIDSQFASSNVYVNTDTGQGDMVFGVNFADGRIKGYGLSLRGQDKTFFVIFVRGNPDYGINNFIDNGDGTVSDLATGLSWTQADSEAAMSWEAALDYCESLDAAGIGDWRLPTVKELQGIVDYTRSPGTTGTAAIDPIFEASSITDEGGVSNYAFYWSSTTHANLTNGGNAAYVAFGEALGWMQSPSGDYELIDVHGAGAQRSDPKAGDPTDYPYGLGPQGDVIRVFNHVRCVTDS